MLAAGLGQVHDVMQKPFRAEDAGQLPLQVQDEFRGEHLLHLAGRPAVQLEHLHLAVVAGVAHLDPQEEAVELGLGQPVDALLLHRVLSGQHQERLR